MDPEPRLSRYENGHVEPSLTTFHRLALVLNIDEATLLGNELDVVQEFSLRRRALGIPIWTKEEAPGLADLVADQLGAPKPARPSGT